MNHNTELQTTTKKWTSIPVENIHKSKILI